MSAPTVSRANVSVPFTPEDKLAQLEHELTQLRASINATRTKHADLVAKLPALFEVHSLADVVSIIQGGVAQAGTKPAPAGKARGYSRATRTHTVRGQPRARAHISDWKRQQIIRAIFGNRQTVLKIAAKHGVSPQAVYAIKGKELRARASAQAAAALPAPEQSMAPAA